MARKSGAKLILAGDDRQLASSPASSAADRSTGQLTARHDGGRAASWSSEDFQGFRHGYAGTIYKGQGKTLDHTPRWGARR